MNGVAMRLLLFAALSLLAWNIWTSKPESHLGEAAHAVSRLTLSLPDVLHVAEAAAARSGR
jgi:HAMP domain-containing protein